MTVRETLDIISDSSLWETLSIGERIDAVAYAMKITGSNCDNEDISDLIGEVYAG